MPTPAMPACSAQNDAKPGSGKGFPIPPMLTLEMCSQTVGSSALGTTLLLPPSVLQYPLGHPVKTTLHRGSAVKPWAEQSPPVLPS